MSREKRNGSTTESRTAFRATQQSLKIPDKRNLGEDVAVSFFLGQLRAYRNSGRSMLKGEAEQILWKHGMSRALARETLEAESKKGNLWRCQKLVGGDGRGDPYEIVISAEYVFPDEVDCAVRVWLRIFGHNLDPQRVKEHISILKKWEANRGRNR